MKVCVCVCRLCVIVGDTQYVYSHTHSMEIEPTGLHKVNLDTSGVKTRVHGHSWCSSPGDSRDATSSCVTKTSQRVCHSQSFRVKRERIIRRTGCSATLPMGENRAQRGEREGCGRDFQRRSHGCRLLGSNKWLKLRTHWKKSSFLSFWPSSAFMPPLHSCPLKVHYTIKSDKMRKSRKLQNYQPTWTNDFKLSKHFSSYNLNLVTSSRVGTVAFKM